MFTISHHDNDTRMARIRTERPALRLVVDNTTQATPRAPASDPTIALLTAILREVGADLPSPLAHRIRTAVTPAPAR